jgi:hypothetical protein
MSFIAIVGAGAIGGALAQRLAARGRVREVRLIDDQGGVAQGKALDIQQSGAVDGFTTRLSAASAIGAAAGAAAVVIADASAGDTEHTGEAGLALVKRLAALEARAPAHLRRQHSAIAHRPRRDRAARSTATADRVAPAALESAVRALAALDADGSASEMQLRVVGVPPRRRGDRLGRGHRVRTADLIPDPRRHGWRDLVAPAAAMAARPLALASAAARVAEAAANGSRRRYSCFVCVSEGEMPVAVLAMPAEIVGAAWRASAAPVAHPPGTDAARQRGSVCLTGQLTDSRACMATPPANSANAWRGSDGRGEDAT